MKKIWIPVTILECPPMRAFAYVTYIMTPHGKKRHSQVSAAKQEKDLARKMNLAKQPAEPTHPSPANICDVTLLVHTQPIKAGIGKKTPEVFEVAIGGKTSADKLTTAQGFLRQTYSHLMCSAKANRSTVTSSHAAKDYKERPKDSEPDLEHHKSEKGTRGPGNVGGWTGNRSWRVAPRTDRIPHEDRDQQVGGQDRERRERDQPIERTQTLWIGKGTYMLLKGSVGGPSKRLIRLAPARRPNHRMIKESPKIDAVGTTA